MSGLCPCGLNKPYSECCEPIIAGQLKAPTAESLMRARYSAYVKQKIDFLKGSFLPKNRHEFDEASVREWSMKSEWVGLEIVKTTGGRESDEKGTVEFLAKFQFQNEEQVHHELAEFEKENGVWFFVDGNTPKKEPIKRDSPKIGRNDPCPCGSGKKHKKCCFSKSA